MRYVFRGFCILTVLVMLSGVGMASGTGRCCAGGYGGFPWNTVSPYAAPACMAPLYGSQLPGCCPCPPPGRCDHIWDGYCSERCCHGGYRWCGPSCGGATVVYPTSGAACGGG